MANELKANEFVKGVPELTKELDNLSTEIKELREEFTKTQKVFDNASKSQSDLTKKTKAVAKADSELEKIRKRQNKITLETVRATEQLRDKRKKLTDQVRKENGTIKKSGGLFKSMAKGALAAGAAMLSIRAAFNIFKTGIKTIAGFEGAMSKVRAITGATAGDFKALQVNAKLLGSTTSKTAIEVAGLQLEFSKLGFSTKEILAATEATISLSIAAGSDLAGSAVVAASTVRGFGLSAKDTQKVVDVMAKSFASSALDLEKFKTSMAISAPIAKNFGKDIEFTTAQLSILSNAGIDASTSGTSLRNIFLELSKRGLTWEEGLEKINNSTNKNVTALDLFGKRGATAAVILAENTDKADKLEESYRNSAGAAKRMADVMEDNLLGETKKLSSAWEGFILSLNKGDGSISKFLSGVVKLGTKFLGLITDTEKESEALSRMRIEMNANLDAIKNQELPLNVRNGLIEDINTQYKDYLPNLIDEKTSLEDIEAIQKQANTALLENIRIKAQQELLTEQINKIATLEVKIAKTQIKVEKLKAGEISHTASAYLTQEQQISGLNVTIKNLTGEYQKEVDELNKIQSIFDKLNPAQEESNELTTESTKAINDNTEARKENGDEVEKNIERLKKELAAKEAAQLKAKQDSDTLADSLVDEEIALADDEIDRIIDQYDEEYRIKEEAAKKDVDLTKLTESQKREIKEAAIDAAGQIVSDRLTAGIDDELAKFQAGQDAQQKIFDTQLENKQITEEEFAEKSTALKLKSRQEEAKAEKKKALFDIAIATAVAAVKALPALPLVALVVALGAIQAAVVASRPIPKFKHGTSGELQLDTTAIVGDGGKPELITTPKGDFLSPATDTMVHLPRGSQVFSGDSPETQAAMSGGMTQEMYEGLKKEQQLTRKAISNQPKSVTSLTDKGLEKAYITKQNKINFRDEWCRL